VEDRGHEPEVTPCGNRAFPGPGGAESGAVARNNVPVDFDLDSVIEAWSSLSTDIRTEILTIVPAAAPTVPWLHEPAGEGAEISTVLPQGPPALTCLLFFCDPE